MADCAPCGKSVLTYVALDDDNGAERRVCVHCDTPIAENLKWVSPGELEQAGYYFGPPPAEGEKGRMQHRLRQLQRQEVLSAPVWRSASYTTIETAFERFRLRTPASKIGIR